MFFFYFTVVQYRSCRCIGIVAKSSSFLVFLSLWATIACVAFLATDSARSSAFSLSTNMKFLTVEALQLSLTILILVVILVVDHVCSVVSSSRFVSASTVVTSAAISSSVAAPS